MKIDLNRAASSSVLLAASMLTSAAAIAQQPVSRPNIIFILVDDLPVDNFGVDNPTLRTPNLDKLVKNGTYVPRAAVTTSLCSPSRATILTGMTTRNHGIVDNQHSSEEGLTFFPKYLQQAGYQTAYIGKWHMGADDDRPRPGFDHWVSFKGQGTYGPKGDFGRPQQQTLNVNGKSVDRIEYMTDELTRYQMKWLEKGRDPSKPFFLYMSHKAVHGPCVPPDRYKDQYEGQATMTLPKTFATTADNLGGKPMWVINQRNSWHGIDIRHATGIESMIDERRACDQVLSGVDDSVGQTLDYLKKSGLDRNTMVVFFSDNGSMWGAHGLVDKRNGYEESVRVPMVVSGPGIPKGVRSEARIRNLDLAPTFLAMAGVASPAQFEGQSALPLLQGKTKWADWKQDDFIYEYYWEWAYPMTPTTFAIVSGDWKYIQYHGIWDRNELYNLAKDPQETVNLISDPAYTELRSELRAKLHGRLTNSNGKHMVPYSEVENTGFVFRNVDGMPQAPFPSEVQLKAAPGEDFEFFDLMNRANKK